MTDHAEDRAALDRLEEFLAEDDDWGLAYVIDPLTGTQSWMSGAAMAAALRRLRASAPERAPVDYEAVLAAHELVGGDYCPECDEFFSDEDERKTHHAHVASILRGEP